VAAAEQAELRAHMDEEIAWARDQALGVPGLQSECPLTALSPQHVKVSGTSRSSSAAAFCLYTHCYGSPESKGQALSSVADHAPYHVLVDNLWNPPGEPKLDELGGGQTSSLAWF